MMTDFCLLMQFVVDVD